jgi:DNA polymerase III epsilon subunit-like protein
MTDPEPIVDLYNIEVPSEIRSENWRDLNKIAVFDVETTGLNWNDPDFRIIQFTAGVYNLEKDSEVLFYNQWLNPEIAVPVESMKIHGLYHDELNDDEVIEKHGDIDISDCYTFEQRMAEIVTVMRKADLWCAYNHSFDVNALASELKRHGFKPLVKPCIDPRVFEVERKQKFSGTTLWDTAKDYGVAKVSENDLHDAKVDVLVLKDVLKEMAGKLPQSTKSLFKQQTGYMKRQEQYHS